MVDPEGYSVSMAELAGYRLWHLLHKARFFDNESRRISLGDEESESAWASFCERHKVNPSSALPIPTEYLGCTPVQLREAACREWRIGRWKELEFGPEVEPYFDQNKSRFERVVYSLLRVRDEGIARELWFRLHGGEATFPELAQQHGGGMEKLTGGIIGPVALGAMQPLLASRLRSAREGELLAPFSISNWHLVVRLEKRIPTVLDAQLRAGILDELATRRMEEHDGANGN